MKLIVNGDDFGITHACNLAVIDCYKKGIMKSASLMTNMPFAEEAVHMWAENPDLSVGIHFSLTAGKPLTEAKSLIDENGKLHRGILRHQDNLNEADIRDEMEAQFQRFILLCRKYPDHINSHHGIEAIPAAMDLLQEYSLKYHIPMRRFLRDRDRKENYHIEFRIPEFKMFIRSKDSSVSARDVINGFKELMHTDLIVEWAAHPGYVDKDLLELSSLTTDRCYDADLFMNEEIAEWVRNNHIELISYKDLKR